MPGIQCPNVEVSQEITSGALQPTQADPFCGSSDDYWVDPSRIGIGGRRDLAIKKTFVVALVATQIAANSAQ